ncbi:MAG: ornithine carbamoyltransferase [Candidatus Omnitrophota bacterium]
MKSLVSITDLKIAEAHKLFEMARLLKHRPKLYARALQGKSIGLIFEKPSTRTWLSFDVGVASLGGHSIYLGPDDLKLGVREDTRDVARVMERYLDGVVMRTFSHQTILQFQQYFRKPVINGLSDLAHPCQALADFFTIGEHFRSLSKIKIAFVGDGNNVLNSNLLLAAMLGARFHYATPGEYQPRKEVVAQACEIAKKTGARIEASSDPRNAVKDADVIYTDVWVSMGEEKLRTQKVSAFQAMQVNRELVKLAKPGAYVMHCLPAHRGEEITEEVLEGPQSVVFDQAENRLHVQKAVLIHLFSGKR